MRFIVVALFFDALAPLLPTMALDNDISTRQFQFLLGACYVVFALSQLASACIATIGAYRAIAASSLLMSIAGFFMALADDALWFSSMFFTLFACNGIGASATRVALRAASTEAGFKRLLAWVTGAVEIKQIAMPLLVGAVAAGFGWRWALVALMLPVFAVALWMQLGYRQWHIVEHPVPTSGWCKIAASPAFFMPTLIAAAFEIGFSPVSAQLPFILSTDAGLDALMTGLLLSCSSRRLMKLGLLLMCVGLLCMLVGRYAELVYAITGMIAMQAALGFIVIPCAADAINTRHEDKAQASALFGFLQPVVCGVALALAAMMPASGVLLAIAMTLLSVCLIGLLLAR